MTARSVEPAEGISPLDALHGRHLLGVTAISPWDPRLRQPSPSAALLLWFGDLSLLCVSPLRFRSSRHGSTFGLESGGTASFRFRIHLGDQETLSWLARVRDNTWEWLESVRSRLELPQIGVRLARIRAVATDLDSWALEFVFGDGSIRHLRYRPDLDGSLEFNTPGVRHHIEVIEVSSPRQPFGWLHPAAPQPFVFRDFYWQSAALVHWPFFLRQAVRASPDPERAHNDILLGAMCARFQQNTQWRERLAHLVYPVACPDCPSDIYQALKAS
jgi:hypothetical protein